MCAYVCICQPRLLYPVKIYSKNEGVLIFSDKSKLREFVTSRFKLQEIEKKFFRLKESNPRWNDGTAGRNEEHKKGKYGGKYKRVLTI